MDMHYLGKKNKINQSNFGLIFERAQGTSEVFAIKQDKALKNGLGSSHVHHYLQFAFHDYTTTFNDNCE